MNIDFICDLSGDEKCREELGFRHIRFHGLLSYPMDMLIIHKDELLYSFFNADQIAFG